MDYIEFECDDVSVTYGKFSKEKVVVSVSNADETDILNELHVSEIVEYAASHFLDSVIEQSEKSEVLDNFSWEEVKEHFSVDILQELSGMEDEVLEEIGWNKVKNHFSDNIDAEASEIAQDLVVRGVE